MTPTNDAPVTVEQCDREAAADHLAALGQINAQFRIRTGMADEHSLVQTLARHRLAALASAPAGDGVPNGWRLVPIEPDDAMLDAGVLDVRAEVSYHDVEGIWSAMLAAAPTALARPRAAVGEREA
jgi:hypothetical protein